MNVFIRADASSQIGSGHVARTLTLANGLRARGSNVTFVCRPQDGDLIDFIASRGYEVKSLPSGRHYENISDADLKHASWLCASQEEDAQQTIDSLVDGVSWLVVDHYGIDKRWHSRLRNHVDKILVIDDLADRELDCDLLLDQNLFHNMDVRYRGLLAESSVQLLGPEYALLRPEFIEARARAAVRDGPLRRVLVFFGGADPCDETSRVLQALDELGIQNLSVDVVVGAANVRAESIRQWCDARKNLTYHCQVSNMAELMLEADLSFGACGVATWERCAVLLPTIAVAVAYNQIEIAEAVAEAGAVEYIGQSDKLSIGDWKQAISSLLDSPGVRAEMSRTSASLVDCMGVSRVVDKMMEI